MKFRTIAIAGVAAFLLAGCNYKAIPDPSVSEKDSKWMAKVPNFELELNYQRYEVEFTGSEAPGTIIVDTKQNFVYFVLGNKKAVRYGAATGSEAYGWTGEATVNRIADWPRWVPPAEMVQRWPHLAPTLAAGGLNGGPDNPLGARALYLYQGNKDTLYRIHGTNEPHLIGRNASSGCIRMRNIDVIDLANRVKPGAKVIVR